MFVPTFNRSQNQDLYDTVCCSVQRKITSVNRRVVGSSPNCGTFSNKTEDEASHVDEDRRQKRIVKAISVDSVRKLNVFITLLRKWLVVS